MRFNSENAWRFIFINFPVHNFIDTTSKVIDICSYQHINKESIITNSKIANAHELFGINLDKNKKYNIIVLFIEGTSYQILHNDLTPNLCKIQNESINIINYYNHTLPTFRGIRGQLTSTYQLAVGADDKLPKANSLAYIMNTLGYNNVFVSPHTQQSKFNTWIKSIEFNKIYSLKKNIFTFFKPVVVNSVRCMFCFMFANGSFCCFFERIFVDFFWASVVFYFSLHFYFFLGNVFHSR